MNVGQFREEGVVVPMAPTKDCGLLFGYFTIVLLNGDHKSRKSSQDFGLWLLYNCPIEWKPQKSNPDPKLWM